MKIYKRIQFKKRELIKLRQDFDDYIWAAVDSSNYSISLGDEYLADLRDCLLMKRSQPENVYGIGFNLETGEVDYVAQINRRNPRVGMSGKLSEEEKEKIDKLLHYFFEKLPVYRDESKKEEEEVEELSDTTISI
ncbi:MAG: hypothetical protein MJ154_00935 [Candidatus Saccharibacteria bacterium]|nr:hypothetical protein [Candidatus Saccharibacteria bacterium]